MNWNLEGSEVKGLYLGEFLVTGNVVESRVTYGGSVKHTVHLHTPRKIFGSEREQLILKSEELYEVDGQVV